MVDLSRRGARSADGYLYGDHRKDRGEKRERNPLALRKSSEKCEMGKKSGGGRETEEEDAGKSLLLGKGQDMAKRDRGGKKAGEISLSRTTMKSLDERRRKDAV